METLEGREPDPSKVLWQEQQDRRAVKDGRRERSGHRVAGDQIQRHLEILELSLRPDVDITNIRPTTVEVRPGARHRTGVVDRPVEPVLVGVCDRLRSSSDRGPDVSVLTADDTDGKLVTRCYERRMGPAEQDATYRHTLLYASGGLELCQEVNRAVATYGRVSDRS